ncbi:MAG: hypothetical protein ABI243_02720 [Lapillicoccus sp.]
MKRWIWTLLASVSLALVAVVTIPSGSAQACTGCPAGGGGGGYHVTAVVFSGDAAPGGGGTYSVSVPATCWWKPASLPADPTTWVQWFLGQQASYAGQGSETAGGYYSLGTRATYAQAARRALAGEKITAYVATCRDNAWCTDLAKFVGGPVHDASMGYGQPCPIPGVYQFYPPGNPPQPQVDPADLARLARDRMVIPVPQVDRNPKVRDLQDATLVRLPTWFWVTNPPAVGGASGTRTIRAEVGPVFAQVIARTDGLVVTSPAGGTTCSPAVATRAYAPGASAESGCTVSFQKSSVGYAGGFPVDTSTAWTATWTGSGGTGGALPGLARTSQVAVPVAEAQAITTGTG